MIHISEKPFQCNQCDISYLIVLDKPNHCRSLDRELILFFDSFYCAFKKTKQVGPLNKLKLHYCQIMYLIYGDIRQFEVFKFYDFNK